MNEIEIKTVKDLIAYQNDMKWKAFSILGYNRKSIESFLIQEKDVFVDNEIETLKNVFNLVKEDYDYLEHTFKKKLLHKLAKKMFKNSLMTADTYLTYYE